MKLLYFLIVLVLLLHAAPLHALSTETYEVKPDAINAKLGIVEFKVHSLLVTNKASTPLKVGIELTDEVREIVQFSPASLELAAQESGNITLIIFGRELGTYEGLIKLSGDITADIPMKAEIVQEVAKENLFVKIKSEHKKIRQNSKLDLIASLDNLLIDREIPANVTYILRPLNGENLSWVLGTDNVTVKTTVSLFKEIDMSEFAIGNYILEVRAENSDKTYNSGISFSIVEPLYNRTVLNIPLKFILLAIVLIILLVAAFFYYRKQKEKNKRYKSKLDFNQLPKPGPRSVVVGKIAETTKTAHFEIDQLMMHTLVAGSTGGGKTVSAEVLIEEALNKGSAAIIFDPTAQWTGFLRKNTESKMFAIYPQFGMKKEDAKAFSGNVKQILDARELIEVKKFIKPGEITIFAVNKLEPQDIDMLVANVVRQVFKANLPESKELKLILVFDEVHRLLPKFGGSGQGFIQIERAAREFRKWGVGLILISQVLTDFVGETKANIANEIQMRTRDQGDLERIKTKYGSYMLQSLVKSATGTGMYQNPSFNRGEPYFIAFRPLLHEHAALSDDVLANYNKYNEIADDIEYQVEQLKELNIDVFDLTLELKMALDKLKAGNFNMVDIYLESLRPRLESQWQKIGKKPKKKERQMVDEAELKKELEKAMKLREKDAKPKEDARAAAAPQQKSKTFKLKDGLVIMNLMEFEDALPTMTDETYRYHFENGEFADWVKELNPVLEAKLRVAKTKELALKALKEGGAESAQKK